MKKDSGINGLIIPQNSQQEFLQHAQIDIYLNKKKYCISKTITAKYSA